MSLEEERVDGRWNSPHLPSISCYSMLQLREKLTEHTVFLDVEATDLKGVAHFILGRLLSTGHLEVEHLMPAHKALMLHAESKRCTHSSAIAEQSPKTF